MVSQFFMVIFTVFSIPRIASLTMETLSACPEKADWDYFLMFYYLIICFVIVRLLVN